MEQVRNGPGSVRFLTGMWKKDEHEQDCSSTAACGSVLVACGFQGTRASLAVVRVLRGSAACGIFSDQGLNPCPLHWQVDSYPLSQQQSSQ